MPSSDYTSRSGALRIKGLSGVSKPKKKKKKPKAEPNDHNREASESRDPSKDDAAKDGAQKDDEPETSKSDENLAADKAERGVKTQAELRFEEQRRKRLKERLAKEGPKTHRQNVEAFNTALSKLSEHNDM